MGEMKKIAEQLCEKQNSFSFRYGNPGSDIKLYFEDEMDLERQLEGLAGKSTSFNRAIKSIKERLNG